MGCSFVTVIDENFYITGKPKWFYIKCILNALGHMKPWSIQRFYALADHCKVDTNLVLVYENSPGEKTAINVASK